MRDITRVFGNSESITVPMVDVKGRLEALEHSWSISGSNRKPNTLTPDPAVTRILGSLLEAYHESVVGLQSPRARDSMDSAMRCS